MVGETGIEPVTYGLEGRCSKILQPAKNTVLTTELQEKNEENLIRHSPLRRHQIS